MPWQFFGKALALAATALGILALSGCAKSSGEPAGWPNVFRFAYSSTLEDNDHQFRRVNLLRDYLARELRIPVELSKGSMFGVTIEALRARKLDSSSLGPFGYLIASARANVEPLVAFGSSDGAPGSYNSIIMVPASSPVKTMDDLLARAPNLTFTFCNAASTSGHLVPRAYLESIGINPEKAFKRVLFSQDHIVTALTVSSGKVDAGATMESIIGRLTRSGKLRANELRVIWKSAPIVRSPIVIRKDLPAGFRERVRQAFLNMPLRDPKLLKEIQAVSSASGQVYVPVDDSMFAALRDMAKHMKTAQLAAE